MEEEDDRESVCFIGYGEVVVVGYVMRVVFLFFYGVFFWFFL